MITGMYVLTLHNKKVEVDLVFKPVFKPVLLLGPPTILGPVYKPGKGLSVAHVLEQKGLDCPMVGSHACSWALHFCIDVDKES